MSAWQRSFLFWLGGFTLAASVIAFGANWVVYRAEVGAGRGEPAGASILFHFLMTSGFVGFLLQLASTFLGIAPPPSGAALGHGDPIATPIAPHEDSLSTRDMATFLRFLTDEKIVPTGSFSVTHVDGKTVTISWTTTDAKPK